MPLIKFKCGECGTTLSKFYRDSGSIPLKLNCKKCNGVSNRLLSAPSSKFVQVIDDGTQAKQVKIMDVVIEKEREKIK